MDSKYVRISIKSKDIYILLNILKKLGWKTLRETSINRIIYLSSVLYSFIYNKNKNIFSKSYNFTITLSGPEDAQIKNALIYLESNNLIEQIDSGYKICINNNFFYLNNEDKKKEKWFEDIAYIISIYGEDKIYDFIFRDPEYRKSLLGNSIYNLNIDKDNTTVKFLNIFKEAFEKELKNKNDVLDNKKYMELYFEYIFGMILRGEINHVFL